MISASIILNSIRRVTKEWTKQRKAEERGRRSRASREYVYSDRVHFTEVVADILPDAYQHASGGERYSVSKRQLYYACREAFREQTGRELKYNYFSNTLLVQYLNRHPETERWKITADSRGSFTIPNAGHRVQIPCGTLEIERLLERTARPTNPFAIDTKLPIEWPSLREGQRYQAVLYIEKQGFEPLLDEASIGEQFGIAILTNKGQSVVAGRRLVDHVCRVLGGVPLFVAHDLDKAGFEIAQRLTSISDWAEEQDRVAYRFENEIQVIDLGLRLEDVKQYDLAYEHCEFTGRFASDSIATEEEQEFLRSNRRVELNAFTSPQFVEWLVSKLRRYLGEKRFVPSDEVLIDAYRRALAVAEINKRIEELTPSAIEMAESASIPLTLREQLQKCLKQKSEPWDKALFAIAKKHLG